MSKKFIKSSLVLSLSFFSAHAMAWADSITSYIVPQESTLFNNEAQLSTYTMSGQIESVFHDDVSENLNTNQLAFLDSINRYIETNYNIGVFDFNPKTRCPDIMYSASAFLMFRSIYENSIQYAKRNPSYVLSNPNFVFSDIYGVSSPIEQRVVEKTASACRNLNNMNFISGEAKFQEALKSLLIEYKTSIKKRATDIANLRIIEIAKIEESRLLAEKIAAEEKARLAAKALEKENQANREYEEYQKLLVKQQQDRIKQQQDRIIEMKKAADEKALRNRKRTSG